MVRAMESEYEKTDTKKRYYYKKGSEVDKANKMLEELITKERYANFSSKEMDAETHRVAGKLFLWVFYS